MPILDYRDAQLTNVTISSTPTDISSFVNIDKQVRIFPATSFRPVGQEFIFEVLSGGTLNLSFSTTTTGPAPSNSLNNTINCIAAGSSNVITTGPYGYAAQPLNGVLIGVNNLSNNPGNLINVGFDNQTSTDNSIVIGAQNYNGFRGSSVSGVLNMAGRYLTVVKYVTASNKFFVSESFSNSAAQNNTLIAGHRFRLERFTGVSSILSQTFEFTISATDITERSITTVESLSVLGSSMDNVEGGQENNAFGIPTANGSASTAAANFGTHVEGYGNVLYGGRGSHVEGFQNWATGTAGSHSEGFGNVGGGVGAHIEGINNKNSNNFAYVSAYDAPTRTFHFAYNSSISAYRFSNNWSSINPGTAVIFYNSDLSSNRARRVPLRFSVLSATATSVTASSAVFITSQNWGYSPDRIIYSGTGAQGSHIEGGYNIITSTAGYGHVEGFLSRADGYASHAAGTRAHARNDYSWVWSSGGLTINTDLPPFQSTRAGQFALSADGGVYMLGTVGVGTDSQKHNLDVVGSGSFGLSGNIFGIGAFGAGITNSVVGSGSNVHGGTNAVGTNYSSAQGFNNFIGFNQYFDFYSTAGAPPRIGTSSPGMSASLNMPLTPGTRFVLVGSNPYNNAVVSISAVNDNFNDPDWGSPITVIFLNESDNNLPFNGSDYGLTAYVRPISANAYPGSSFSDGIHCIGNSNYGLGQASILIGTSNTVSSNNCVVIGNANQAQGPNSIAIGTQNIILSGTNNSIAMGYRAQVDKDHKHSFIWASSGTGLGNVATTNSNQFVVHAANGIFLSGGNTTARTVTATRVVADGTNSLLWGSPIRAARHYRRGAPTSNVSSGGGASNVGLGGTLVTAGNGATSYGKSSYPQNYCNIATRTGAGPDFGQGVGVYGLGLVTVAATSGAAFRVIIGDDSAATPPANSAAQPLTTRGIGFELKSYNGSRGLKLFAHNGTTYVETASSFIAGPDLSSTSQFWVKTDTSGNAYLYYSQSAANTIVPELSETPLLSTTGAPTSNSGAKANISFNAICDGTNNPGSLVATIAHLEEVWFTVGV